MVFGGLLLVKPSFSREKDGFSKDGCSKQSFSREKDGFEPTNHLFLEKTKKTIFWRPQPHSFGKDGFLVFFGFFGFFVFFGFLDFFGLLVFVNSYFVVFCLDLARTRLPCAVGPLGGGEHIYIYIYTCLLSALLSNSCSNPIPRYSSDRGLCFGIWVQNRAKKGALHQAAWQGLPGLGKPSRGLPGRGLSQEAEAQRRRNGPGEAPKGSEMAWEEKWSGRSTKGLRNGLGEAKKASSEMVREKSKKAKKQKWSRRTKKAQKWSETRRTCAVLR